jgi:hypothetical protein
MSAPTKGLKAHCTRMHAFHFEQISSFSILLKI